MAVTVSGMFGAGSTFFADAPVVIDVNGLEWPPASPFNIVRIEVIHNGTVVGEFKAETGGASSISFDISSSLMAMWAEEDFVAEVADAQDAVDGNDSSDSDSDSGYVRSMKEYSLAVYTEYQDSTDGEFKSTCSGTFTGGQCLIGWLTEWERSLVTEPSHRDVSALEHTNPRNGDASTKPRTSPEIVGRDSITSWVDVTASGTRSVFYSSAAEPQPDDPEEWQEHAPLVARDNQEYVDFLFVNRRGAVETCSGLTMESMRINVKQDTYSRSKRPSFWPSRSLMSVRQGGPRRGWDMSSGHQTREWAEWWVTEFMTARRHWMKYKGRYVPVIVEPSKDEIIIYDRSKQEMPHVDFTVTLAIEG